MTSRSAPVVVKVFGILHLIFGSLSLVTAPIGFLNRDSSAETFTLLGVSAAYLNWFKVSLFLSPVLALILIILGIGLLRKQSWARSGSIIYSMIGIVLGITSMMITLIGFSGINSDSANATLVLGIRIGAIIGGIVGLIYPILTIFFMTRPNVKAALN